MGRMRLSHLAAVLVLLPFAASAARGTLLAQESISILNSGGSGGSGASTSDMVYAQFGSDGWGWAGGAGAVQGAASTTNTGGTAAAANEALKFNVGATVDSLNATYGAGNWTIANPTLTFASSYAKQNNARFGVGPGTFDVYWVANDGWAQSAGTLTDKQLNPIYASNATDLAVWAGSDSLLGSETFAIPSGATGYVNLSYALSTTSPFVSDILTASATGSNPAASLYLAGTSDSLGMIIFTGGQGQPLPTLSFDVVSVPEPASLATVALLAPSLLIRRRR